MTTQPSALDDDDLRAMNAALGSQVMILRFPPQLESPWCSDDELAAITVDGADITVRTAGHLTARTALQLAAALGGFAAQILADGPT